MAKTGMTDGPSRPGCSGSWRRVRLGRALAGVLCCGLVAVALLAASGQARAQDEEGEVVYLRESRIRIDLPGVDPGAVEILIDDIQA